MLTASLLLIACAAVGADPGPMTIAATASTLAKTDSENEARQIVRDCLRQHDDTAILREPSMEASPLVFSLWWRRAKKAPSRAGNPGESTELSMFVTNVESRLGVASPSAWHKSLSTATLSEGRVLQVKADPRQTHYDRTGEVLVSKELRYLEDKDAIELLTCDGPFAVPLQSAERQGVKFRRHYSVTQKDGIAFVLEFCEVPVGYNLSAWDCARRVRLWKVYGWGTYREEIRNRPFHDASLVLKDDNIFVFGRSGRDFYIAAWRCATGKRIFEWSAIFADE